jgi:hypothetical protein
MTFEEFLGWYPEDGNCYELMDGEVISGAKADDGRNLDVEEIGR